jgi:ABC-type transport system involved in multi-copper enzyme maturation permease subunit
MSAPPVPSFGHSVAVTTRLQLKRFSRGKKLRLAVVALVLVVAGIVTARYLGDNPDAETVGTAVQNGLDRGFLRLLVYLLPFLFASGVIAEEVEGRTLGYLTVRPVSRWALGAGKYLASITLAVPLLAIGVLLVHLACFATLPGPLVDELPKTLRVMGAVSLLACCYAAFCMLWGAIAVEAAGIVATLHLAVLEFGMSLVPGPIRLLSMNYIASQLAGFKVTGLFAEMTPAVPALTAGLVLGAVTLVFFGFSLLAVATSEFRFSKA